MTAHYWKNWDFQSYFGVSVHWFRFLMATLVVIILINSVEMFKWLNNASKNGFKNLFWPICQKSQISEWVTRFPW